MSTRFTTSFSKPGTPSGISCSGDLKDKDFYERGQSNNLAKHEALMLSVTQALEGLRGVASGRQRVLMTEVPALLKTYQDDFLKLAAGYRERGWDKDWGTAGEWRTAIHDVEQHLPKGGSGPLEVDYLQLRRDERKTTCCAEKTGTSRQ